MAEANEAYNGSSIPPPQTSYHSHGPGRCCACGGYLLSLLFSLIVAIASIVGIIALLIWLVPNKLKFHLVGASLREFNLTNDNILHYNIALNMTVRNPHKKIGIYYNRIEARAYFDDVQFSFVYFTPFYQGRKVTKTLNLVFKGQSLLLLKSSEVANFNTAKSNGVFEVEVRFYVKIRLKIGKFKRVKFKQKIGCHLKLPIASNGTSVRTFNITKCGFHV